MHPLVFEIAAAFVIVVFAVTQVILPALTGMPFFPTFRFRRQDRAREQVKADIAATESELEIEREKQSLARLQERLRTERERQWPVSSTSTDHAQADSPQVAPPADPRDPTA